MITYNKPYIAIDAKNFLSKGFYLMQIDPPNLIGVIRQFRNNPIDEARRREYLSTANLDLTGKANLYRIFCHPFGSCEPLGNRMAPTEIRSIMTEMADFFVNEISKERSQEFKEQKTI